MSIIESAMHLTGKGESVEGVDQYQPPKKKGKNKSTSATAATQARACVREESGPKDKIQIREDKRNYRRHSDKNLSLIGRSLDDFGAGRSIVADSSGQVIGGNGTLREANKRGIPQRIIHTTGDELVVVVRDDIAPDDPRRQKLAIMDNSTSDTSEFEFMMLQEDFSLPELEDMGIEIPEDMLSLDDGSGTVGETDPDAVPEPPEESVSVRGKVYQLGKHRLMCGDSTSADDVALLMAGDADGADLWLSDPPYNVAYEGKTKDALTIQNDSMGDSQFREFLRSAFDAVFAHTKPGASFYIFHADSEGYNFRGAIHDCGQKVRRCLIWKKQTMVMGRQDYQWIHEPILYGWKEGAAHKWKSDRCQTTVLEFNRPSRNDVHPTMKPIDILLYLIGNSCDTNDIVIDTFGGSGSTLIACEQGGRICRTMELDEHYCDVIRKRWAEFVFGEGCDWESLTPETK